MNWNKILSLLAGIAYVMVAAIHGGTEMAFKMALFLVLPLACIWFSQSMGAYTGKFPAEMPITQTSPAIMVQVLGWVVLLMPAIVSIIISLST